MTEKTLTMRNHLSLDAECYIEEKKWQKKKERITMGRCSHGYQNNTR